MIRLWDRIGSDRIGSNEMPLYLARPPAGHLPIYISLQAARPPFHSIGKTNHLPRDAAASSPESKGASSSRERERGCGRAGMALLCFLLDLRNIPPPLLHLLKQVHRCFNCIPPRVDLQTLTAMAMALVRSAFSTSPTSMPPSPHHPPPPPRSPTASPSATSTPSPPPTPPRHPRSASLSLSIYLLLLP